jgi:hypothetical protein
MLLIHLDLEFLPAILVGLGPVPVILLGDLTLADDSLDFLND